MCTLRGAYTVSNLAHRTDGSFFKESRYSSPSTIVVYFDFKAFRKTQNRRFELGSKRKFWMKHSVAEGSSHGSSNELVTPLWQKKTPHMKT